MPITRDVAIPLREIELRASRSSGPGRAARQRDRLAHRGGLRRARIRPRSARRSVSASPRARTGRARRRPGRAQPGAQPGARARAPARPTRPGAAVRRRAARRGRPGSKEARLKSKRTRSATKRDRRRPAARRLSRLRNDERPRIRARPFVRCGLQSGGKLVRPGSAEAGGVPDGEGAGVAVAVCHLEPFSPRPLVSKRRPATTM